MVSTAAHPAGPRHAAIAPEAGPGLPPEDVHALAPRVWPRGILRDSRTGALILRGHDVTALADDYGTPAYLVDEDDFRSRAREFRAAFGGASVYYAAKAFLCTAMARWVDEEGLSLDVCTAGELRIALAGGFPAERIAFHGNNKSTEELALALQVGVRTVVVDSLEEISRLADLAADLGRVQDVLVRVTVGVEAHTHEFIATAHEDVKFGFSLSTGAADQAVDAVLARPSLRLRGIHSHIGSQIFDTAGFEVAAHRVIGFLAALRDRTGTTVDEVDLGGGFGIAYLQGDDPAPIGDIGARLAQIVLRECRGWELPAPRLAVEPGRALIGAAGLTLYTVGTVKALAGVRTYVSVDGGMSDNLRTALYGADYTVTLANRVSTAPLMLCRIVGKHCESGDIVVRDAWLPDDLAPGDLLAVAATGAYCYSMSSNYNAVGRPPVVAVTDDAVRPIIRRQTIDDVLACDLG